MIFDKLSFVPFSFQSVIPLLTSRGRQFSYFYFLTDCLSRSKLPSWARAVVPKIFYVTEKAWNYYPYTVTGEGSRVIQQFVLSDPYMFFFPVCLL